MRACSGEFCIAAACRETTRAATKASVVLGHGATGT